MSDAEVSTAREDAVRQEPVRQDTERQDPERQDPERQDPERQDPVRQDTLPIREKADIVRIRQEVRAWTANLDFGLVEQTKMITAASELARNALDHGEGGEMHILEVEEGGRRGVRLIFVDEGPGIADLEQALRDGFSTGSGMGLGLSGARRLVDEFEIDSRRGEGTRISITRWIH